MKMEKIKNFFKTRTAKSIIVASCALLIGLAIYLNYQWFYDPAGSLGYGDNNMADNNSDNSSASGNAENKQDYFTSTALDRQEARDEALDVRHSRRSRRSPLIFRTRRILRPSLRQRALRIA